MDELDEEREPRFVQARGAPAPHLLVQRAAELNSAGRHDLAEDYARRALAGAPDEVDALVQLALARHGLGRTREGEALLSQAVASAPESSAALGVRALLRTELGRYSEAEEDVLEALRLEPESGFLFRVYAQLVYKAGQLAKAEKLLRRALELDPEDESAEALLALVLSEGKQKARALQHGKRSLARAPEEDFGHVALGIAQLRAGRPFAARRALREALRLDPDPETEALFLEADRCCRIVFLPMYYWSLVLERLPGKNIGAWALFMLFVFGGRAAGLPPLVLGTGTLLYVVLCVYSWIASFLVKLWVKWFPPRL